MNYTILLADGVEKNFNDWNSLHNTYNCKPYTPKRQPAKRLIENIIREFKSICETYHIDASKYTFIEPTEIERNWWQFDFLDAHPDKNPARIMIHDLVIGKNYTILQRVYSI